MAEYALTIGASLSSATGSFGAWANQNELLVTALGGGALMIFACAMLFRR